MQNQALFLPKGSVRAILIIFLTGWISAMLWFQKPVPESIIILWAGAIGWYFGGKIDELKNKNNNDV